MFVEHLLCNHHCYKVSGTQRWYNMVPISSSMSDCFLSQLLLRMRVLVQWGSPAPARLLRTTAATFTGFCQNSVMWSVSGFCHRTVVLYFFYLLRLLMILIVKFAIYLLEIATHFMSGSVLGSENTRYSHCHQRIYKNKWWRESLVPEFTERMPHIQGRGE